MNRAHFITLAALFGFLAVAIGAFGAHGLKPHLNAAQLTTFQTASEYHFYHTLALLLVALLMRSSAPSKLLTYSASAFTIGVVLFSGSLYLLATKELLGIGTWASALGPITPLGGLFFLAGWVLLFIYGIKNRLA